MVTKKKSKLKIVSEQREREDSEKIELETEGYLWKEKDSICLSYNESKTTGFEDSVTTIKICGTTVSIDRTGEYSASMIVEKNKERYGHYLTPMGGIDVGTRTYEVKNEIDENGGSVYLRYGLYVNGAFMNLTNMLITAELM